jgi:hypothetical protein
MVPLESLVACPCGLASGFPSGSMVPELFRLGGKKRPSASASQAKPPTSGRAGFTCLGAAKVAGASRRRNRTVEARAQTFGVMLYPFESGVGSDPPWREEPLPQHSVADYGELDEAS